jgi:hypothetical protein
MQLFVITGLLCLVSDVARGYSFRRFQMKMDIVMPSKRPKRGLQLEGSQDFSQHLTGFATELGSSNTVPANHQMTLDGHLNCYFDKSTPCSRASTGTCCSVDGRPCSADRSYMDHVYGARGSSKKPRCSTTPKTQHMPSNLASTPSAATANQKPPANDGHDSGGRQAVSPVNNMVDALIVPQPSPGKAILLVFLSNVFKATARTGLFFFALVDTIIHFCGQRKD